MILRNTQAQVHLIDELLDMNQLLTGKVQLHLAPIRPSFLVESAIREVRPHLIKKGIQFTKTLESSVDELLGDEERLRKVVVQLLSNAIKFTPEGGRIHLEMRKEECSLVLEISDSGVGISEDDLPVIFDGLNSNARRAGRIGLGLAIARHLVELHGGEILAKSDGPGKGATFSMSLPISHRRVREFSNAELAEVDLSGIRVLVVDDDADTRDLMTEILSGRGAEVASAATGKQALAKIDSSGPDVVICDIGMPEMDGLEFIRELRGGSRNSGLPAVALTAHSSPEDRKAALDGGYDMFVSKPVDPAELASITAGVAGRFPSLHE